MAPFLISALITLAAAAPTFRGNGDHDEQGLPATYRGYNGQPGVQKGDALKWVQANVHDGPGLPNTGGYQCFRGDLSHYPAIDEWLSFDALWDINKDAILSNNDGDVNVQGYIQESILQVAGESNVNPRLILSVIMQESAGKASVHCTGHMPNCGLMQASYNSHSFDPSNAEASILEMIREGVEGTISGGETGQGGPGYAQFLSGDLTWVHDPQPGNPYTAARSYNSGSVASDDDLDNAEMGVASYANDIANRLIGWDGSGDGFKSCYDGQ